MAAITRGSVMTGEPADEKLTVVPVAPAQIRIDNPSASDRR